MLKKIFTLIAVLTLGISVGWLMCSWLPSGHGTVLIKNDSDQLIKKVVVDIGGVSLNFSEIKEGELVVGFFYDHRDSAYQVEAVLESGDSLLLSNSGYVSSTMEVCELFIVDTTSIKHVRVNDVGALVRRE